MNTHIFGVCRYIIYATLLLLLYENSSAQSRLQTDCSNVKIGGGGFVSSIIAHPSVANLFYARTDVGGAYRWNEESQSWESMMDWVNQEQEALYGVESFAVDKHNPGRVYLTSGYSGYGWSGQSFLSSDDFGSTWKVKPMNIYIHGNGMGRQTGEKLQVDPFNADVLWLGSRQDGLLRSKDRGNSWQKIQSFPVTTTQNLNGVSFLLPDAKSTPVDGHASVLYAGVSRSTDNLYVSKDGGLTWSTIPGAPVGQNIMPHKASFSDDGQYIFITYANGAGPHPQNWDGVDDKMNRGAVYRYDTKNLTWLNISPVDFFMNPIAGGCFGGISFAHGKLYVSSINHYGNLQYFTDGSSAWGDRLYESSDLGLTWRSLLDEKNVGLLDNNDIGWISGHNLHWVGSFVVDPFNAERVFATSGNGVFMTNNVSAEHPTFYFHPHGIEETVPLDLMSVKAGPSLVSVIGDYDGFIHSEFTGFPSKKHSPSMGTTSGVAVAPNDNLTWARVGGSAAILYYTIDGGNTWTGASKLPTGVLRGKIAVQSVGGKPLICWVPEGSNDKIYITNNGGLTWTNVWEALVGNVTDARPVADPFDSNVFYIFNKTKGSLLSVKYSGNSRPEVKLVAEPGSSGSNQIVASTRHKGRVFTSSTLGGLMQIDGNTVRQVSEIKSEAISLGPGLIESDPEAIYIWGRHRGLQGMYRSTDEGKTWFLINDEAHMYGGLGNGKTIAADNNVFGRVFMTTAARGVVAISSGNADTLYLDPLDGITSLEQESIIDGGLTISPVPALNTINVESQAIIDRVKIYNIDGKLVFDKYINQEIMQIDVSLFIPGTYIMQALRADGRMLEVKKFIKN